jgi:hypothetical protein
MTDAIKKAREALADRIVRDVCELEGYTSPENQPDLLEATTGELRAIILNALAAEQSRPEPEGMETTATQRDLWKAVNYDKVAPADPSSMWRRIEMLCRDIDRLLAALRQPAADDVEAMAQRLDAHVPDGFADLHKAAAMLRALSRQPAADEVEDVAAILETAVRPVYVGEGQFRSIGREAAAMLRAFSPFPRSTPRPSGLRRGDRADGADARQTTVRRDQCCCRPLAPAYSGGGACVLCRLRRPRPERR